MPAAIDKAVCYVVQDGHLLVFTHLRHPMHVTGVQVPAGTIKAGEAPDWAALRELHEETGLEGSVVRVPGHCRLRPAPRPQRDRHQALLRAGGPQPGYLPPLDRRGTRPRHGGVPETWECWWLPLEQAHVLAAGLGARLGRLFGTH